MAERAGFEVECPSCGHAFVAARPERPFRHVTRESVARVPPDVRTTPRNPSPQRRSCEHCGADYFPARNTRQPRFCSRSCARRNYLARKHGFVGTYDG